MQGRDLSQRDLMSAAAAGACETGLRGMETLIDAVQGWPERSDAVSCLAYLDNAIVKFGTGGGFFRNHFATFLSWTSEQWGDLVSVESAALGDAVAAQWNALSPLLREMTADPSRPEQWSKLHSSLSGIHAAETHLFEGLGERLPAAA